MLSVISSARDKLVEEEIVRPRFVNRYATCDKLIITGRELYVKSNYVAALDSYEQAVEALIKLPNHKDRLRSFTSHLADAAIAVSQGQNRAGNKTKATETLLSAFKYDPDNELLIKRLNRLLGESMQPAELYLNKAKGYILHQQYEKAHEVLAIYLKVVDPAQSPTELDKKRSQFQTTLLKAGPAPQDHDKLQIPKSAKEVFYKSGELKLKSWISTNADIGKNPAIVFLHGGFAFSETDWDDIKPFTDAGYIVMIPMLRGENSNPGNFEAFYGEVDDAIAAGQYLQSLPSVDKDQVFIAGHSVGGILTTLVSERSSPFKAAASLSAYFNIGHWLERYPVVNAKSPLEVALRDPLEHIGSLNIPLLLCAEDGNQFKISNSFYKKAKQQNKTISIYKSPGDHMSMVKPSLLKSIEWFKKHSGDIPTPSL